MFGDYTVGICESDDGIGRQEIIASKSSVTALDLPMVSRMMRVAVL